MAILRLGGNSVIEEYIFKTIISFISVNAVIYMTKENFMKVNPKKNGFIKKYVNRLAFCLIPVFRWVYVFVILVIGIALGSDDFVKMYKQQEEENKKDEK